MALSSFQMEYHYQHHFNMFPNIPSSSITATNTNSQLDPRLWRRLPNFLLARIIAFLPAPSFFRFQSVCRRWYTLLFSDTFLQTYHSLCRNHHWFIFFKRKTLTTITTTSSNGFNTSGICEGFLYDPVARTWYRLTFPSWLSSYTPAASSNGLIAWVSDESGQKNLIVSNPVRREFAPLPSTLTPRLYPSVGLVTTNSAFYLMVAGDDLVSPYNVDNISTESFHAYKDESNQPIFSSIWNTQSRIPRLCNPHQTGRMVFVDGKFFCMSYNPSKIFSYDISTNTWTKIKPPMGRFIRWPGLVECGGRLFLVAAVAKDTLTIPKSVRVWEFQNGVWGKHPERMPEQVYKEFAAVENGCGFDCVGHGKFIVITFNGSNRVLLFDLGRKKWQWIPDCPYLFRYGGCSGGSMHAFAYEPMVDTPVIRFFGHP